jgi:hypothetical protein
LPWLFLLGYLFKKRNHITEHVKICILDAVDVFLYEFQYENDGLSLFTNAFGDVILGLIFWGEDFTLHDFSIGAENGIY